MELHFPVAGVVVAWPLLVILGFLVGVLQGFFGVGGGWLTTPTLNMLGFPFVYAIGTDLAFTAVSALMGALRHLRLGHLDFRLALPLGIAGMVGLEGARRLVLFLEGQGVAGLYLRLTYIVLLCGVGVFILWREMVSNAPLTPSGAGRSIGSRWLKPLAIGPEIRVLGGEMSVPITVLGIAGLLTGLLAGLLGTGGGFVLVPILVYALRVPGRVAVATSLLAIVLTNGFGSLGYGVVGRVELLAAGLMFGGAFLGTQLGALATAVVPQRDLQRLLGVMLVIAGLAVAMRQASLYVPSASVMFLAASGMTTIIVALLWRGRLQGPGFRPF
ncbi:MAG: sulfite exporter TauE/SafE family protein [Chloroflexi bacterium]|nr:sulfite exporter TauE/SafE family protein [Chloroflexota bacterium]